jgi:hypothetical protein
MSKTKQTKQTLRVIDEKKQQDKSRKAKVLLKSIERDMTRGTSWTGGNDAA